MTSKSNINVKLNNYDSEKYNTRLELRVYGKNINNVFINSLRRTALSDIPIYAWEPSINANTSVFNNNYLKLRLENLPVFGIKNDIVFFNKEENEKDKEPNDSVFLDMAMDDLDLSPTENKVNTSSLNNLTMYLEFENKTSEIVTVSTADCDFYYKENKIKSPYDIEIPIVKLQPKQKINLSCVTKLGKESQSAIFSPVSVFYFQENKPSDEKESNDFNVILESKGQITEKEILIRCVENLKLAVNELYDNIPDTLEKEGVIKVGELDHTIGNLVSYYCYKNKDVDMFSYNLPHPLRNQINFNFKLNNSKLKVVIEKAKKEIINDLNVFADNVKKVKI